MADLVRVKTIPWSCPCCQKCQMIVEGEGAGQCLYGGPFGGYRSVTTPVTKASQAESCDKPKSLAPVVKLVDTLGSKSTDI